MIRKLILSALVLVCVLCAAFVYARYLRPRAFPYATLIVDTPKHAETLMVGIVPVVEPVAPGLYITWNVNPMTFEHGEHELAVSWSYLGGALGRDFYRIESSFDGVPQITTVSISDDPVVLFSQDGYKLWIDPDRADLYAPVE